MSTLCWRFFVFPLLHLFKISLNFSCGTCCREFICRQVLNPNSYRGGGGFNCLSHRCEIWVLWIFWMGSVVAKLYPDILTKTYFSEEKSNAIGGINHCYQHFQWITGPWRSPSLWWSKRYQSCVGDSLPFLPSSPIYYHFIFPLEHDAEVKTNSGIHFQTSSYSTNPLKNLYCLEFLPLGGAGIHWKQLQF